MFEVNGECGRLKFKYLDLGILGPWHLTAQTRDNWTLTASQVQLDEFSLDHLVSGRLIVVELSLGKRVSGYWRAGVSVLSHKPLTLRGLEEVVVVESEYG